MAIVPNVLVVYDANGNKQSIPVDQDSTTLQMTPHSVSQSPIVAATAGAAHIVVTGGTAVTAIAANAAGIHGGLIINPHGASESLFVDVVNTAGTTAPGVNGTTVELIAGERLELPAGLINAVSVNAVTSSHGFTALVW